MFGLFKKTDALPLQERRPPKGETLERITEHLATARDDAHRREICLTWDGYIAALMEWSLISVDEHAAAYDLIRASLTPNDPSAFIFMGRDFTDEELVRE